MDICNIILQDYVLCKCCGRMFFNRHWPSWIQDCSNQHSVGCCFSLNSILKLLQWLFCTSSMLSRGWGAGHLYLKVTRGSVETLYKAGLLSESMSPRAALLRACPGSEGIHQGPCFWERSLALILQILKGHLALGGQRAKATEPFGSLFAQYILTATLLL